MATRFAVRLQTETGLGAHVGPSGPRPNQHSGTRCPKDIEKLPPCAHARPLASSAGDPKTTESAPTPTQTS
eukprot:7565962-Lingulodinium_polyedra.AAC.1